MSFLKSFSVFHIPSDGAEVTDGEAVSMRNSLGADPHVGHAVVSGGAITGVHLNEATACFVDDDDAITVVSNTPGKIEAAVAEVAAGVITQVRLNADVAMIEADEVVTVNTQGGLKSATAQALVGGGVLAVITLTFDTIVSQGDGVSVQNSSATKTVTGASAHVSINRILDYVALPATAALIETGDTVGLASSLGANRGNVTPNINMGFLTNVQLPAQTDVVSDGASKPLTRADNTGLLAMVTAHVPSSDDTFESVALPATAAVVTDAGSVSIENSGGTQNVTGIATVAANVLVVKLPASAAFVADGVGIAGAPVTGTYTNTVTPQVSAAGVITGFTLS